MNFINNILKNLIKHIEKVIKDFEKRDINYGGCGMIAIQVSRYLHTFGFSNIKIRASFLNKDHGQFENAEHYSVIVKQDDFEYEINPPKFEPYTYSSRKFENVDNDVYFLNGSGAYKHQADNDFVNALYKN